MKVVFLDFDGVLNGDAYVRRQGRFGVIIDPSKMELLRRIITETDAKIVLTTSWREHWDVVEEGCDETGGEINRIFRRFGLEIYDKTPHRGFGREKNMRLWLDGHPNVRNYVALDDQFLSADFLKEHFVLTSNLRGGMDAADAEKAIAILKGEAYG